jgi:hypothetical protein
MSCNFMLITYFRIFLAARIITNSGEWEGPNVSLGEAMDTFSSGNGTVSFSHHP